MTAARVYYHLARADFLERVRRRGFLVVLGAAIWVAYIVSAGIIEVRLGDWRGLFNSAWAGSVMAIVATTLVTLAAFYIVKNSVDRDRQTGVGQILATTPMTRVAYTVGKWLSNLAVLSTIVAVLAVAGFVLQVMAGEVPRIEPFALLAPMAVVAVPAMAFVAALALLFEMIPGLRGGFGNLVYFFLWTFLLITSMTGSLDGPFNIRMLTDDMQAHLRQIDPEYEDALLIGGGARDREPAKPFEWRGIEWTPRVIAGRLGWLAASLALAVFAALPFDRFDPARRRAWRLKQARDDEESETLTAAPTPSITHFTPLGAEAAGFNFAGLVAAELRLLLKGRRWWWYVGAAGLVVAGFVNSSDVARAAVLPAAWIWPALLWSSMGARDARFGTTELVFSAPRPIWRQLPATWCAGVLLALAAGSGVALNLVVSGDSGGLAALVAGACFVPALALAAGAWTGGTTLFEALYVALWYLGPLNHAAALDYMGAGDEAVASGMPLVYAGLAALMLLVAAAGRRRQMMC